MTALTMIVMASQTWQITWIVDAQKKKQYVMMIVILLHLMYVCQQAVAHLAA